MHLTYLDIGNNNSFGYLHFPALVSESQIKTQSVIIMVRITWYV